MSFSEFRSDLRQFFKRPTRKGLARSLLPLLVGLLIFIAVSFVLYYVVGTDPEEFAEDFKAKHDNYQQLALLAIFLITLFSSLTIFLPAPGTAVVIALVTVLDLNIAWAALVGGTGGTLGEISAYWLGREGRAVIDTENSDRYRTAEKWMGRYGGLTIVAFAFIPILIFDLAGIAAGAVKYPVKRFFFFCWIGRVPRAGIEYYLGASLFDWILDQLPWKT
jgi:membrane protein DedA with SNARE-associated domain